MRGIHSHCHRPPPAWRSGRLIFPLLLLLSLALFAFSVRFVHFSRPSPHPASREPVASAAASSVDSCAGVSTDLGRPTREDKDWRFKVGSSDLGPKICITSTTSAGLDQILPWIFYHKAVGIKHFFLFVEGKAATPASYKVLASIPGVTVQPRTREFEELQANSRIWNETWLSPFFYKPCNYELFVKQTLNMENGIHMAKEAGMDWIVHLDTDELIHPSGTDSYSVQKLLADVPQDVDLVIFPNYESAVERDDIREPFSEVSMFKKSYDHISNEVYFRNFEVASHGNPNYFLTYGNGKSAARVQDHLRPNGAHRWHNYMKVPREISFDEAAVLHYTYSKFSDLTSRRDRCGCKLTKKDIEKCFMLEFDRNAFVIASTGTLDEMLQWYRDHVVWQDTELNLKLLKEGVMTRIHAPMVIIQSLRESGLFSSVITNTSKNAGPDTT